MEKNWLPLSPPDETSTQRLITELGVPRRIAELLVRRNISTFELAKTFFRPSLGELHDPFSMTDMVKAVERLSAALEQGERILVYGDYDVDGTTAVSLMVKFLAECHASVSYYIPDRYLEGYGFSTRGVDFAVENECSLIVTLDCGIKDTETVRYANSKGIDVIICDHHKPETLPPAFAILNPKRPDCSYPYKGLSGCGVGFKLLQALCIRREWPLEQLYVHLDLLTISIGADIVPLDGENRILAHYGLQLLNQPDSRRPGVSAMLEQAGRKKTDLTISDVVFILAPRINAAGRIFSGKQAVELLLSGDAATAAALSPALEENNNTRRLLDKEITREALEMVEADAFYEASFATVVHKEDWHKGVVGIVASRLVETYYKPAIVLSLNDGKLSGSARSIPGIDLYEALNQCQDLLVQFGGHTMAAGLSLLPEHFTDFRHRFDAVVAGMLENRHPVPVTSYESELYLSDIHPKFWSLLRQFAPFGPENMKPVFRSNGLIDAGNTGAVGSDGKHLKVHLKQAEQPEVAFYGIAFEMGQWAEHLKKGGAVDVLYTVDENHWNGRMSLQIQVRDIRPSESMV
jgi:single-stranded-DNA-specific exonuclease